MSQATLREYGQFEMPSSRSSTNYIVRIDGDSFTCNCAFMHPKLPYANRGLLCRHILQHQYEQYRSRSNYLEAREEYMSEAIFSTFEQALAHMDMTRNAEIAYLQSLILAFGYTQGEVCADDVYAAVGGKFFGSGRHSGNVMGASFRGLSQRKWISRVSVKSSDTPSRKGSMVGIWILTDAGKEIVKQGFIY